MASTRLSAAAYEMPNISATCATVSISLVCFFLLMFCITHGFVRRSRPNGELCCAAQVVDETEVDEESCLRHKSLNVRI